MIVPPVTNASALSAVPSIGDVHSRAPSGSAYELIVLFFP